MANKYQLADSATEALKEKLIHTNHVHLFGSFDERYSWVKHEVQSRS